MKQPKESASRADPSARRRSGAKCPVCRKPATPEFRPFCSKRCGDIDLGRWLGDAYRVPGEQADALRDDAEGRDKN